MSPGCHRVGPEGSPERALAPRSGEGQVLLWGSSWPAAMWMLLWLFSPALSFPAATLRLLSAPLCAAYPRAGWKAWAN